MFLQVARRLGIFAVSLLGASLLIFIVTQALPGDVARVIAGEGATDAEIAALRAQLGLDRPFSVRYLEWLGGMVTGDFGSSYLSGQSVSTIIRPTLGITAWLVTFALALAVLIAIPAGMVSALHRRRPVGVATSALAQLGMAVPAFWAGVMLTYVFAVWLRWLPPNGYVSVRSDVGAWAAHLVLPVLSLALVQAAVLTRYVRGAFVDVLHEDYYRTARAIGWTRGRAMIRHGLRNASLSLVTVLGLQLAAVLVGAIVIEQVFVLPGLGSKLLYAVSQSDTMVIQGIVMLLVLAVLGINFIVDVSYVLLDPQTAKREQPMKRLELYLGSAIVLTVTAMAVTSLFWTPFSTTVLGEHPRFLPPGWPHVLGTDSFGSDTFSLLLVGARVVLMVGVIAVGIAAVFGVPLGIAASHAPAWASEVLMRATDVAYAFPALLLAILLAGVFGGSTVTAMTAIGVATIPQFVRVTRAGALQVYASDFVLAARACGTGRLAIARQHVLPNIAPLIGVQASVSFAMAILAEAALSYLGLGTQPPTPTWGRMLHEAQAVLIVHPLQAVWPGLAVVLAVLGFNLLGDGLRDLLDPRLREVA